MKMDLHYTTKDENLGDPIPFFWKGEYHIFYICRSPRVFRHIVSRDLLEWEELPIALPLGAPGESDCEQCASGSVIERDGTFHFFYCGRKIGRKDGEGTICHASSRDLIHWKKDPKNPVLTSDFETYEGRSKDPFVFWNEEEGCYWMLITDRLQESPTARKGVLALAVSPDLEKWERRGDFWAPDVTLGEFEVPDLFQWNGTWYLIYTEYSESNQVHYRMAKHCAGPWLAPAVDTFDGPRYQAGKTVGDGKRRFIFGWIPTRQGKTDEGPWEWGGHMGIREVIQQPDGSLAVKCPEQILRSCGPSIPSKLEAKLGEWSGKGRTFHGKRVDGLAYAVTGGVHADLLVEVIVTLRPQTSCAGILFRTTSDLAQGYMLRLEPRLCRVVFDRWPRIGVGNEGSDRPFMVERSLHPDRLAWGKPIVIQLFIHGTIAEVFVGNQVAMVTRIYDCKEGCVALFVENGEAKFQDVTVRSL